MSDDLRARQGLSRRTLLQSSVSLGAAAAFSSDALAHLPPITLEMARAATEFLGGLDDRQRQAAQLPWGEGVVDWHYVPRSRSGVPLGELDAGQGRALWNLLVH